MSESDAASPSSSGGREWLVKATEDLAVAELVLRSDVPARWAACFHAQQAAEKALKALLVARGIDFPRTHALERLIDLLDAEGELFDRGSVLELSAWAVAGRYPDSTAEPTTEQTGRLVRSARSVLEVARAQFTAM